MNPHIRKEVKVSTWFVIWIIGSMFVDGLLDPTNVGGYGEGIKRFFCWPWELGQYISYRVDK